MGGQFPTATNLACYVDVSADTTKRPPERCWKSTEATDEKMERTSVRSAGSGPPSATQEGTMLHSRRPPTCSHWLRPYDQGCWRYAAVPIGRHQMMPLPYPLIGQQARPLRSRWGMSDRRPPRDARLDRHPQRPDRFLPLCAEAPIPRDDQESLSSGRPPLRFGLSGAGRSSPVLSTAIEAAKDAARTTEKEYDNGDHRLFHRFR